MFAGKVRLGAFVWARTACAVRYSSLQPVTQTDANLTIMRLCLEYSTQRRCPRSHRYQLIDAWIEFLAFMSATFLGTSCTGDNALPCVWCWLSQMLCSHDAAVAREQVLHITTHARVRSDGLRCVACVQTVQQYVEYNPRFVCSHVLNSATNRIYFP